jgi:hypothetical protein
MNTNDIILAIEQRSHDCNRRRHSWLIHPASPMQSAKQADRPLHLGAGKATSLNPAEFECRRSCDDSRCT